MKFTLHLLTALAICCLLQPAQAKRAPNLEFKDVSGKTQKIADLRGAITVVNFWATWCGPCREELPMLSRLEKEYGPRRVRFIAISADEARGRKNVDKFLSANPIEMDVWLGASLATLDRAELGNELPATMILDEQGEVVARILGQAREEDLRRPLDWMLAGKTGLAPQAVTKHY
ncbi:MAG: TlpA disulfide reductase family protein [Terracidiphilus sp.]